ncbi:homoserine kinase [Weeksellaceae bacterium TAE3-ERU29]|nr:homoserine kinase [Weeksellaceae bacterium TAE3-ERU29]
MKKEVKAYAPATVANVVCGYDVLGFAIEKPGDEVVLRPNSKNKVEIIKIEGDNGKLSYDPDKNVVGHVIKLFLEKIGSNQGVDIELYKKMPLNSGLGSSAASSVAALVAINELMDNPMSKHDLLPFTIEGERLATGNAHADNVAPSLLGGLVLTRSYEPLDIVKLPSPKGLYVTSVHPNVDVPTGEARKIIKQEVPLKLAVQQWGNVAGLVAGFTTNDLDLIGRSMQDVVIEPVRSMLIPYFKEMKESALEKGAIGFGISGSGPSVFALSKNEEIAENVKTALEKLLEEFNIECQALVTEINHEGAKILSSN